MNEWALVGIGLLLTVGTGLFVASEFALVNLDRKDLEARERRGEKRLGPTIKALRITSTHLSSAQLGITLTTLLTGYTFEPAITSLLTEPLTSLGLPAGSVRAVGGVLGIAVATLFSMVIGELVPKNFALALPLATAKVVIPFQAAFTTVFKPVILTFNNTANAIIRSMGIEPKEELSGARSAEELSSLVRRSALQGMLDQDHATLLGKALEFSGHTAAEVMTPRVLMDTVTEADSAADVLALAQATGHSRFVVTGEDIDHIVGVVHVKHAFAIATDAQAATPVTSLMVEPLLIPVSMGIDALLGLLRRSGFQIAVATDEYGGTAGLVTLEDLVEELIGELQDEHDERDETPSGVRREGATVIFDAGLRPDELADRAQIVVPDTGDYETVAGFVTAELGRLPVVGDEVGLQTGVLRVSAVDGRRVEEITYVPHDRVTDPSTASQHDQIVGRLRGESPAGPGTDPAADAAAGAEEADR